MKMCTNCNKMVEPKKNINILILILMTFFTGGIWLILYALYYFLFKKAVCPICHGKNLVKGR